MSDAGSTGEVRLQKFMARAGVASRRKCEELILQGRVKVNGSVVAELGTKVRPGEDVVEFDGAALRMPGDCVVIMLNKPPGYLSAMADARDPNVVSKLVPVDDHPGLFPVGRLDRDTTGLLLFTTDGELGHSLLHPSRNVAKRYVAEVEGVLSEPERASLESGVVLDDGPTAPARCEVLAADASRGRSVVALEIHEGRKRQVRRMLKSVGHEVLRLHRESFGPVALGGLPQGEWRVLDPAEVASLRG